jgi:hypothetical protein
MDPLPALLVGTSASSICPTKYRPEHPKLDKHRSIKAVETLRMSGSLTPLVAPANAI